MNEIYYKHYISIDTENRITFGFSDAFRQPQETDICINGQGGYQFRLFPGGTENPALFDFNYFVPLYKWEDGEVKHRTQEEINADIAEIPTRDIPTQDERIADLEDALDLLLSGVTE